MLDALDSSVDLLREAGRYAVRSGGKRLRPAVLLLASRATGGSVPETAVRAAAAIELLHAASLVHDDIADRSGLRRGQPSVNNRWGSDLALLIGDFVFVRMLKLLVGLDDRAAGVLADACTAVVEGETRQKMALGDTTMSEASYLQLVSAKTAALFAASAEIGALLGTEGAEREEWAAALHAYGQNVGTAFQIRDDTLDLMGRSATMGKPVAADVAQGKMSLATIWAWRRSSDARDLLLCSPAPPAERVLKVLRDSGGVAYAIGRGEEYSRRAVACLSSLPDSPARRDLAALARFAVIRER